MRHLKTPLLERRWPWLAHSGLRYLTVPIVSQDDVRLRLINVRVLEEPQAQLCQQDAPHGLIDQTLLHLARANGIGERAERARGSVWGSAAA